MAIIRTNALGEQKIIATVGSAAAQVESIRMGTTDDEVVTIFAGSVVAFDGGFYNFVSDWHITAADLESGGSFTLGADYSVYICRVASNISIKILPNDGTLPTADASRELGGFHFGVCRRTDAQLQPINASGTVWGLDWESNVYNGILPRSVWTFQHRPKVNPAGMVYLGGGSIWADIYLASDNGAGGALSKHMTMPLNGDDGLTWYTAVQRLQVAGKRLLTYAEWVEAAIGSPQGTGDGTNLNAWSVGSARQYTGFVERAVSSVGCRDCAGNLWEWLDEIVALGVGDEIWQDPFPGFVQAWLNGQNNEFRALLAGGSYFNGARCGSRAVNTRFSPWQSNPSFGVRGACNGI